MIRWLLALSQRRRAARLAALKGVLDTKLAERRATRALRAERGRRGNATRRQRARARDPLLNEMVQL